MPSLSINSKDLDSLGINLKDLLRAIAQTKSSSNEVIKIKKKKKKGKSKKRITKGARLPYDPKNPTASGIAMNPFPSTQPKFTQYPQTGGGGHGFAPMTRVEFKTEAQTQQQRQDDATKQQLELFKNDTKTQLNDIKSTQEYNTYGLQAAGLALTKLIKQNKRFGVYNQSMPPPANLGQLYSGTYYRESDVDSTDNEGNIGRNDPMSNIRIEEIAFEDNPMIQQTELQPPQDESANDYGTDVQPIDMRDVMSETETIPVSVDEGSVVPPPPSIENLTTTPEVNYTDIHEQEDVPFMTQQKQKRQYNQRTPLEEQKKKGRKPKQQKKEDSQDIEEPGIFENLIDLADEGNKQTTPKKQPLTMPTLRHTRSNQDHSKLVEPDTGISPFGDAKRKEAKKTQKHINDLFGKK